MRSFYGNQTFHTSDEFRFLSKSTDGPLSSEHQCVACLMFHMRGQILGRAAGDVVDVPKRDTR